MADRTRLSRRLILLVAIVAALTASPGARMLSDRIQAGGTAVAAATSTTRPTVPPDENDLFPQEQQISDCVGAVQRPNCGSKARGGPAQTALFVALMAGLGFIGWRIYRGTRRQHT